MTRSDYEKLKRRLKNRHEQEMRALEWVYQFERSADLEVEAPEVQPEQNGHQEVAVEDGIPLPPRTMDTYNGKPTIAKLLRMFLSETAGRNVTVRDFRGWLYSHYPRRTFVKSSTSSIFHFYGKKGILRVVEKGRRYSKKPTIYALAQNGAVA